MKESPMAEDTQAENNHPHTVLVVEDSKPDQVLVMNQPEFTRWIRRRFRTKLS